MTSNSRTTSTSGAHLAFTVPGMGQGDAERVIEILQQRLDAFNDLSLTLKHVHWNVVGPQFIAVHQMIDPQVDAVRAMADETAERLATLGGTPSGTPGALVARRTWDDYSIGRDDALAHLAALDIVYGGLLESQRKAISDTEEPDPVSQDMLIGQSAALEQFHWFIRAHLENIDGTLRNAGADTEGGATRRARANS